jgi:hypothetical protein
MDEIADPRVQATKRLKAKRGFQTHLAVYLIVNTFLVLQYAAGGRDGFWPFWTIIGWGVGLAFHGWSVYFQRPITEEFKPVPGGTRMRTTTQVSPHIGVKGLVDRARIRAMHPVLAEAMATLPGAALPATGSGR